MGLKGQVPCHCNSILQILSMIQWNSLITWDNRLNMGLCNLGPRPTITLIKTFSLSFSSKKKRRNPIRRVRNKIVNQSMIIGVLDQRKQSCLTLKYYEIIPGDYNPGNWNGTRPPTLLIAPGSYF